jgi:hypothetical protein
MRSRHFSFLVLLAFILAASPLFAQSKKVRFSVSSISIAEIPFKIAQVKGFYREEGLNVEGGKEKGTSFYFFLLNNFSCDRSEPCQERHALLSAERATTFSIAAMLARRFHAGSFQ